jgi:murein DD-endopeptidase MepM/ murein hydrolase activator NlpD
VNGPTPTPTAAGFPRIYDAVYATALSQQMPKPLVDQLIRILAFDVDLQARIAPGDAMEVFHSLPDGDKDVTDPEILFASLTLGGVTKRFYRFRTGDDGTVDFYDEDGKSAKKFLLRKPVVDAEITSGFGYRVHPIVGERILHSGIDYAAPRMTPNFAAGDGVIEMAGTNPGYGNFILIKHTNGYETAYGHMTKFATGMKEGVRVSQGQIIGYVGSTGLSTGPHVHFEIRINETPVDPLRVRLPQGRTLAGDVRTAFEVERARIDSLLGLEQANKQLASAAPAKTTQIASAK